MVSRLSGTPVLPCLLSCVLKTIPELFAIVPGGSVSQSLFLHLEWKWKLLPVETQILSCAVTTGPVWRHTRMYTHTHTGTPEDTQVHSWPSSPWPSSPFPFSVSPGSRLVGLGTHGLGTETNAIVRFVLTLASFSSTRRNLW